MEPKNKNGKKSLIELNNSYSLKLLPSNKTKDQQQPTKKKNRNKPTSLQMFKREYRI